MGGNYYNSDTIRKYQEITKGRVFEIFDQDPWIFLKNAMLNSFQIFSFGYFNKAGDLLNYVSALIGVIIFLWLLYLRKFLLVLLIAAPSITFTVFYPPIPAYMFGSYVFLIVGLYVILLDLTSKIKFRIEA